MNKRSARHRNIGRTLFWVLLLSSLFPAKTYSEGLLALQDGSQSLLPVAEYYMDSSNALTVDDIKQNYLHLFTSLASLDRSSHRKLDKNLWLKFSIYNDRPSERNVFISISSIYGVNGKIFDAQSLAALPFIPHPTHLQRTRLVQIAIPPNSIATYFARITSINTPTMEISVADTQTILSSTSNIIFIVGFTAGILLIGFAYYILIYIKNREIEYVLLAIHIVLCVLSISAIENYNALSKLELVLASLVTLAASIFSLLYSYFFIKRISNDSDIRTFKYLLLSLTVVHLLVLASPIGRTFQFIYIGQCWAISTLIVGLFMTSQFFKTKNPYILALALLKLLLSCFWICFYLTLTHLLSTNFHNVQIVILNMLCVYASTLIAVLLLYSVKTKVKKHRQEEATFITAVAKKERAAMLKQLSHDLRTPLSSILGMTEIMAETNLSNRQKNSVKTLQSASMELLSSVDFYSQASELLNNDQLSLDEPVKLDKLVNHCIAHYQVLGELRDIEIIGTLGHDVPSTIYSSEKRLQQIIIQLLNITFRKTTANQIVLGISTVEALSDEHINLRFSVSDSFFAISENNQSKLLNTVGSAKINDFGVENLNADIAKQLVQSIGGELGVNSNHTSSSNIWFELSARIAPETKQFFSKPQELLKNKSVLVVDDNTTYCRALVQQLSLWGMKASPAFSGSEAMAIILNKKLMNEPFDLFLFDYNMPGMSGIQLSQRVMAEFAKEQKTPKILILSGLTKIPPRDILNDIAIHDILVKPISSHDLAMAFSNALLNPTQPTHTNDQSGNEEPISANVLLAEDNHINAEITRLMIENLGHSCTIAENGEAAVEHTDFEDFDVIIMDCEMPIMNGFEAAKIIHNNQRKLNRKQTPIIAFSANKMSELSISLDESDMEQFLTKPFRKSELKSAIDSALKIIPSE